MGNLRSIAKRPRGPAHAPEAPEYVLGTGSAEASRLGLQLLHEAGVRDRDRWISDWWASDWTYLSTYYATGKLPEWSACRVHDTGTLLEPMAIPRFTPQRYTARYAF